MICLWCHGGNLTVKDPEWAFNGMAWWVCQDCGSWWPVVL
jgi:hypothetical protein